MTITFIQIPIGALLGIAVFTFSLNDLTDVVRLAPSWYFVAFPATAVLAYGVRIVMMRNVAHLVGGDAMEVNMGKEPSAMIPVIMSLGALVLVAIHLATHGMAPAPDEGAVAHLWQLLMVAQLPVVALFAFRWLRRTPWQALTVLIVQALAWATAAIPVRLLGW